MGFLERILAQKQRELAAKKRDHPLDRLREKTDSTPVRDFRGAITGYGGETKIIAELKARTPSFPSFIQSDHLDDLGMPCCP